MPRQLRLGPEYFWAASVAESIGPIGGRYAAERWDGQVLIADQEPSLDYFEAAMSSPDRPLIIPRRHLETVRAAIGRKDGDTGKKAPTAKQLQDRWTALVEATAYTTTQVVEIMSPLPDLQGNPESHPEARLNAALADLVTQDQLAAVWQESESAELIRSEDVPSPHFSWSDRGPATPAAREMLAEVIRHQGREPGPQEIAAVAGALIGVPPDRRWAAMAGMIRGADESGLIDLRELAGGGLRRGFEAAVEHPETGAADPAVAAEAVRTVGADPKSAARKTALEVLDSGQPLFGLDPAQRSPRDAVRTGGATTGPRGWLGRWGSKHAEGRGGR
ncbi:hypothetical protein [Kribbella sp. NPDC004875]|uniref:hypothetical protein n=1 Tax=Kribbella sp. NPDC004875 TaxID=3364107 RepID=UPI0036CD32C6